MTIVRNSSIYFDTDVYYFREARRRRNLSTWSTSRKARSSSPEKRVKVRCVIRLGRRSHHVRHHVRARPRRRVAANWQRWTSSVSPVVSMYCWTVKRKLDNLDGEPSKFWGFSTFMVFWANTFVGAALPCYVVVVVPAYNVWTWDCNVATFDYKTDILLTNSIVMKFKQSTSAVLAALCLSNYKSESLILAREAM